jgi:hypothetical protein
MRWFIEFGYCGELLDNALVWHKWKTSPRRSSMSRRTFFFRLCAYSGFFPHSLFYDPPDPNFCFSRERSNDVSFVSVQKTPGDLNVFTAKHMNKFDLNFTAIFSHAQFWTFRAENHKLCKRGVMGRNYFFFSCFHPCSFFEKRGRRIPTED